MVRYIDADELEVIIKQWFDDAFSQDEYYAYKDCLEKIKSISTADVVEVEHGEWTLARSGRKVVCSCCETPAPFEKKTTYHTLLRSDYCPHCGAKMDSQL